MIISKFLHPGNNNIIHSFLSPSSFFLTIILLLTIEKIIPQLSFLPVDLISEDEHSPPTRNQYKHKHLICSGWGMGLFCTIWKSHCYQALTGIIIIISVIIAFVRAPIRDDSQDQGLMSVQMQYKLNMRARSEISLTLSRASSINLTSSHCHSSAAALYDLNSSFCSPCDHQHACTKFPFSIHSKSPELPSLSSTKHFQKMTGMGWDLAQNLVPTIKAMGELEWERDFCPKYVYSRV